MSKKNLARTVLEGGRTGFHKSERDHSMRQERTLLKSTIHQSNNDVRVFEAVMLPVRRPVYKSFADKTAPVYRWLDSQVGRRWDDVRSELMTKFDPRTTAGRHIIFDHVLPDVALPGRVIDRWSRPRYDVDENGLLRKLHGRSRYIKKKDKREPITNNKRQEILKWLGVRKIGVVGQKFFWFVPNDVESHETINVTWYYGNLHYSRYSSFYRYALDGTKELVRQSAWVNRYRQNKEFNNEDLAYWATIPVWVQTIILKSSPIAESI